METAEKALIKINVEIVFEGPEQSKAEFDDQSANEKNHMHQCYFTLLFAVKKKKDCTSMAPSAGVK